MLVFIALEKSDIFTNRELTIALSSLPPNGLEQAAWWLSRSIEESTEKRLEYFRDRILPLLQHIWPKSMALNSEKTSKHLVRVVVFGGDKFPEAFRAIRSWIRPVSHADWVIQHIAKEGLPAKFPKESLDLISLLIDESAYVLPSHLRECLDGIADSDPALQSTGQFRRLKDMIRLSERGAD